MAYVVSLRITGIVLAAALLAGCNAGPFASLNGSANRNQDAALARVDGNVPKSGDKLAIAKKQYRNRNFGAAEKDFRAIVEDEPKNAEAWLGLAASYDQLRRFKLADRAYKQVRILDGASVALHNNLGYSYMLRGDRRRARREFLQAQGIEPNNQFVSNNLQLLASRK